MDKRATMHDVADRAGVSQATVSLVLNGVPNARISKATRRRVLEAAEELGYRRGQGHPVPEGRKRIIGLFIDEVSTTPFAAPFLEGARDEAALQDVTVATFCTGSNAALEQAAMELLVAQQAIGAIYTTLITRQVSVPPSFDELPLVLLNCYEKKLRYPSVVPGDLVGGYAATEALLQAGHRRIAHLAGEPVLEASVDREKGFRQAMTKWQVSSHDQLVTSGGWSIRAGRERARALLLDPNPPTAIFCFNDRMAIGCYEAARELGLRVPEDISIVGFDDEDLAANMQPPLSTVILPHDEMARWAVGQLLDGFEAADQDQRMQKIKIECELVARASIAPPRA
ncbi:LacI family DNA-binding transcriptional regulator [Devosia sp. RR2S18]|uniref:LacI family DNA-binding transcriptional regulator n=1 Tax=Devosia rhizosphaerae TaxID=3049774 RepID=UPI00253F7CD7|nr:LacI family DNA-binding transcriptional regulator [Devosia sp. RR2S18]WIJ24061.1 LacI family DNA-binding transcriptional regulator [Devosia sp. RR2S18]